MRSHLTAFGLGASLSLLVAGVFTLVAPKIIADDGEGVHVINIGGGEKGSFILKDDTANLKADWNGAFEFAADGRSLSKLKGELEVVSKEKSVTKRAVFTSEGDDIRSAYYRNDKRLADDEESKALAGDLLQMLARSTSLGAEGRTKALIASGGKEAAIAEIGALVGGHAVGAYIEALAEQAELTSADVKALAERAGAIESDYAKRSAVAALLRSNAIDDAATAEILKVAKSIEGDHELRLIIDDLADRQLGEKNFKIATALIGEIEDDHEVRLAISSILESSEVPDVVAAQALDLAASAIEGDYELRLAVEAAAERYGDEGVGAAALKAVKAIEGDHDKRLTLEAIASNLEGPSPLWLSLVTSAGEINADYEKRLALEEIGSNAPKTDEIRAALRKAAEAISSDHERRLALEELE